MTSVFSFSSKSYHLHKFSDKEKLIYPIIFILVGFTFTLINTNEWAIIIFLNILIRKYKNCLYYISYFPIGVKWNHNDIKLLGLVQLWLANHTRSGSAIYWWREGAASWSKQTTRNRSESSITISSTADPSPTSKRIHQISFTCSPHQWSQSAWSLRQRHRDNTNRNIPTDSVSEISQLCNL